MKDEMAYETGNLEGTSKCVELVDERGDVRAARFSARENFALSPMMLWEMEQTAHALGVSRSEAWRAAAALFLKAVARGEVRRADQ